MKKTKLSIGLMSCLVSVGALAGCDNSMLKSSKTGVLISFNGEQIAAEEILEEYFNDSSKYQDIYNSLYSLVVRNYFNVDGLTVKNPMYVLENGIYKPSTTEVKLGKADMSKINARVDDKIEMDKDTAKTNASSNGTSEKKELEAICSSNGVEYDKKLENLRNKYIDDIKKEMFEKDFYTYYMKDLVEGAGSVDDGFLGAMSSTTKDMWEGYFESQVPYHVSHILVKVEDSADKFADGTISEANAKKLFNVVNQIAFGDDSFSTLAREMFKDDAGSAANGGDLGIMDTSTGYVNEFKLGVYAYENIYEPILKNHSNKAIGSKIELGEFESKYKDAVNESFDGDVPVIDYSVFAELKEYADVTKSNDKEVIENSSLVYPRNIIYNKELNRHSIAFVTGEDEFAVTENAGKEYKWVEDPTVTEDSADTLYRNGKGYRKIEAKCATGFYKYEGYTKPILSVKVAGDWQPVLCVRAGGGDYQGIHFIVINRSAFTTEVKNNVTLREYYTTFYPGQKESYPKDADGNNKKTYVNFASDDSAKTKEKAEELTSKFKTFDSDRLNKYIFRKFCEIENIKLVNTKLDKALNRWIDTTLENIFVIAQKYLKNNGKFYMVHRADRIS